MADRTTYEEMPLVSSREYRHFAKYADMDLRQHTARMLYAAAVVIDAQSAKDDTIATLERQYAQMKDIADDALDLLRTIQADYDRCAAERDDAYDQGFGDALAVLRAAIDQLDVPPAEPEDTDDFPPDDDELDAEELTCPADGDCACGHDCGECGRG